MCNVLSIPQYQSAVTGSDSEVPLLRRPRVPRKRTKPHPTPTHVSSTEGVIPMSSRHTPSHAPPSSLLTSYTAMGNMIHHNYSINDSGFASDTTTCSNSHRLQQENIPCHTHTIKPHPSNVSSENIYKTPVKNIYSRGQGGKYPDAWGSSPFTDHLKKTGRIQSVPPWFVCSDKRKDGKVRRDSAYTIALSIPWNCAFLCMLYSAYLLLTPIHFPYYTLYLLS